MAAVANTIRGSADETRTREMSREMQRLAEVMEHVADRLDPSTGGTDDEQQRIAEDLSAARKLRGELQALGERMSELERQNGRSSSRDGREPGNDAQEGERARLEDLRREYAERARELARLEQSAGGRQSGGTSTPEGHQYSYSAPGTEAFKQDFSRWQTLHKDITLRLERLEASLSRRLLERAARERVRSGAADEAPDAYESAVQRYFRSLADAPSDEP